MQSNVTNNEDVFWLKSEKKKQFKNIYCNFQL